MANPLGLFIGKVPAIYAVTLILVFLTWVFALIVGEDGQVLFNAAFALMAVEITVPIAVTIVVVCFAMNIVMPIAYMFGEFFLEMMIDAATGATSIFGFDLTLTNPFTGATWIPLVPETYVSQLLAILNAIHEWMTFGVAELPEATAVRIILS